MRWGPLRPSPVVPANQWGTNNNTNRFQGSTHSSPYNSYNGNGALSGSSRNRAQETSNHWVKCCYCQKLGHFQKDCYCWRRDNAPMVYAQGRAYQNQPAWVSSIQTEMTALHWSYWLIPTIFPSGSFHILHRETLVLCQNHLCRWLTTRGLIPGTLLIAAIQRALPAQILYHIGAPLSCLNYCTYKMLPPDWQLTLKPNKI
jgi:hypothetical protein